MIGAQYRAEAYNSKVSGARLLVDLTALLPHMTTKFAAVTPGLVSMELSVKQVLDGAGVPTIDYPFYLNFGREMYRKGRQQISGESLALFAAVMIAKWTARGLTPAVLQALRTDVFSVAAPIAP